MKVLFIANHLNIGGISSYMLILGRALLAKGVSLLVASSGGELEDEFLKSGMDVVKIDFRTKSELSPKVLAGAVRLSKLVRDKEIDMMHAHTRVTQIAAAISSAFTKVPYVATCHGFFKRRLGRMLFGAWGSKAIAISGPVRESLIRDFGVPPGKISLVRNGIELDRFSRNFSGGELAGFKEAIGLKDWPVIGTIGRLSPVKGQKTLIEALRNLNAQCVIVGDGPESARLKGLAKDLGVDDRVYFLKSDMDTAKFLAVMDVFVLPSMKEGLGLALMEAMAAGRPCVASDVGGISDIVKDGSSGLVFPAGDAGALKAAISRLIGDEPLRRRLGASAARFARENFSSGAMAEEIVKVYREVLAQYAVTLPSK